MEYHLTSGRKSLPISPESESLLLLVETMRGSNDGSSNLEC